jgi:hypothetical protein
MLRNFAETFGDCHKESNRTADCHKENNHTADSHSQDSKFDSGLPRSYSCFAIDGTLESSLPRSYSCRSAVRYKNVNQQSRCSWRRIFLMRDLTGFYYNSRYFDSFNNHTF